MKLKQAQSMSYLGSNYQQVGELRLNQVNGYRSIFNSWRLSTAASVGFDLDPSALCSMVLYVGHEIGQDPFKMFLNTGTLSNPTCPVNLF